MREGARTGTALPMELLASQAEEAGLVEHLILRGDLGRIQSAIRTVAAAMNLPLKLWSERHEATTASKRACQ